MKTQQIWEAVIFYLVGLIAFGIICVVIGVIFLSGYSVEKPANYIAYLIVFLVPYWMGRDLVSIVRLLRGETDNDRQSAKKREAQTI